MKGYTFLTVSLTVCAILLSHTYLFSQNTSQQDIYTYRTMDGSFNDLRNQTEGMAGNEFIRMHDKSYYFRDGQTMMDRGNARHISNQMFHQYSSRPDPNNLSSLVFTFLQFLDHDITFTKQDNSESHPITIPKGDPQFDPFSTGKQSIPFSRVAASRANSAQRQQINEISAWIDASMILLNMETFYLVIP